jgi:hypothetical protein
LARKHLTESEIRAIATAEHDDLRSASSEMAWLGQAAKAEALAVQAEVLASYVA